CSGWTYGFHCNTSCGCLIDNTQSCDIVTGNCTCKPGFESINCELDVNECNQSSSPCAGNLQCYNTDGSFLCIEQLIYARVTLNTSDLRLYENDIVHNFQQTLQTYLDQFSYVTYFKVIVKHTVTIQSISTSDIFYDLIIVHGKQSFDYYLSLFIYDHFISGTRKISINGTELELRTFQLFASSEEAKLGINPKINQMCQYFGICPSDRRCLNSEFLPICQEICDYGMFTEEEHCKVCKHGQTTLIRGANSQYLCIDNCTENQGYYFLFDKLTCTSCSQDMYRSDVDNTCHVCPYTSYNSSHCIEGGMRTVNNPLLNIELDITIVTPKCLRDDPLYFNNIDEKGLVQLMISQNGYSRFCSQYINCGNVIISYVENQICVPDASCTLNKTCTQYYSRVHIGVYHIGTYISSTSATNNHDQSSVDMLMRTLYDTTKLYQWIPFLSYQAIRLEQPFNIKVTPIDDVSQQVLYITNIWSGNLSSYRTNQQQTYNTIFQSIPEFINIFALIYITYNTIFQSIPEFINIFALSTYGSSYDTIISNYEIWLRKDVDDLLIESIAKIMVLSHEKLGGNLTGPLLLYKTQQDRADGKMAITWKDVINSISVGQYFCNGGNFILSDRGNGTYDCIETCGDWTWGENCTVPCNCLKNNTVVCERQRGACNCTPDFDGSSCERQIDRCLLYSPCDQHADCINTLKHYECRCHTGFKNNLSNPDICEGECQIPGQGHSWLTQTCQPCGQDEYNDGTRNYCIYCPYTESIARDTCFGSNYKTIKNVDLEITFDYQSNFCQFTDEMATKGGKLLTANLLSNFPNSGLCLNLINCDNMIFQINKSDLCKLGKTCSQSANCTDFITRASVNFYNVPEFVSTSSNELRQSIEVFVESLSNLTQLNTNLTDKMKVAVKLPPVNSSVSVIPDNENRLAFIKASVNYQLEYPDLYSFLYTNSLKELGQIVSTYLYPKIEDISSTSSSLTTFTASFMFKEGVNDNAINAIAEAIITSHEQFGGKFGDSIYSFTGSVAVFRSKSDKDKEVSAIKWCSFLLDLQNKFSFEICAIDKSCKDTKDYFQCVDAEDPLKAQRALYPYGPTSGDKDLSVHQDMWWWWWWGISSDPIYFPSGVPFGDRKIKIVTVQANGVIRFGKGYDSWWPYLYYDPDYQEGLLAPFWFYYDYYNRNNGKTYYQLYETSVVGKNHSVIQRATSEIKEFFQLSKFKVTYVLVATWVNVEPYKWYSWICQYYQWYGGEWWFQYWYKVYYDMYCYKKEKETNTFQAVYATDGETGYVTVTYKKGDMSWQYDYWMPIVVGYANSEKIRDFGVTYTDLTTKMDVLTWNTGRYGTWMEQVGKIENTDSKCLRFYQENQYLINNYSFKKNMNQLYKCPCSLDRLGAQWWGYSWNFYGFTNTYIYCVAIGQTAKNRLLSGNPLNKLCCYRYTYPTNWWDWYAWDLAWRSAPYVDHRNPDGSHLLLNDPWWWWYGNDGRKSKEEDFNPHKWCCVDSSCPSQFCNLFNKVRPDLGCSLYAEFISGSALGDPHINTLDGTGYTMNGLGEFILLFINELNFTLQARTQQALSAAGNATKATVFSAFAAKEGDTATFQVELSADSKGMIINSCGADLTTDFYADERYNGSNVVADVKVSRKEKNNKTIALAAFPSSISIEIYNADGYLEFSVSVPKDLKGKTLGLLGNYNDDPNDDFVLPNGTSLSNASTEREIYEQFAKKWGVTSLNSVFKYKEGENATTYQFPKFEPLFLKEVNETIRKNAEEKCQNNIACVFDYVATGNEAFATATLAASSQAASVKDNQMNSLPVLSLTSALNDDNRLQVYEGKEVTIHFAATDVDNDVITYQLVSNVSASFSINNQTGDVTYSPNSLDSVLIGVQAKDSKGGLSSIVYISLVVCPTCSSAGTCNLNKTRETEYLGGKFLLNSCNCWPAYTGNDCEREVDGCLAAPCSQGQTCRDLTAAEQKNSTVGYDCGACPDGYELRNSTCTDINECGNKTNYCDANELCENSVGSYRCYCDVGYRKDSRDKCSDINECAERTHKCNQICTNIEGSYDCTCYSGSVMSSDNKTCIQGNGSCSCSQFCTSEGCACTSGYQVDGLNCIDVDECNNGNKPCSQVCQNTVGGFMCSCFNGFKLDADGVSCKKCSNPYYGKDCASQCVCNGLGTCHNVKGCICNKGWTGTNCNTDVDECTALLDVCPAGQVCTNTVGSYTCSCPSGYVNMTGICTDIDECADVLTHSCNLAVEDCVNNKGNYSCVCRSGYARNSKNTCEDLDECAKHTDNCEHLCENIPGKFNCYCRYGYRLKADRASCVLEKDVCASIRDVLNCTQYCTVNWTTNVPSCFCRSGFDLVGKEQCIDQDECKYDYLNLCSYKAGCVNTPGGYNCTCPAGQMLDNDKRSCVDCGTGNWGENCANDCACSGFGAATCDAKSGCVCKTGFTGQYCDIDVDECQSGLLICTETEKCVNTYGSALCQCINGYKRINDNCQDINECAFATTNDCDQICENYIGGYACKCSQGYTYNSTLKKCQDIDECKRHMDGCQQGCENTEGGYRCTCPDGLKLKFDGETCEVDKGCTVGNPCKEQTNCYLNSSGVPVCYCHLGQQVDPSNPYDCIDVDLCNGSACTDYCSEVKENTSFACSCPSGKKLEADGVTCTECIEGFYGSCESKCQCNPATTSSCNKIDGTCQCKPGYAGTECISDIDECSSYSTYNCPSNSTCENIPGAYICKCQDGYYTNNGTCQVCPVGWYGESCIHQCACDKTHSTCDAVTGTCICFPGWNGTLCDTDSNECTLTDNQCTVTNKSNWVCFNTLGSYHCDCDRGFENQAGNCSDQDECAASSTNRCSQRCTNIVGSYLCSCHSGYTLGTDGYTCQDINECDLNVSSCEQVCSNTLGGYTCSCNKGYHSNKTDSNKCYRASENKMTFIVNKDVSQLNINERLSYDFSYLKKQVEEGLQQPFSSAVSGLTELAVIDMRPGSLIIDFIVVVDLTINPTPGTNITNVLVNLTGHFILGNESYTGVFNINGITVSAATDKCVILTLIVPCDSNENCVLDANGNAVCVPKETSSTPASNNKCALLNSTHSCGVNEQCFINSSGNAVCVSIPSTQVSESSDEVPLIVGLSVGLPLFAALVVLIILVIWYKKKYIQQRRVDSREGHYQDEDRPPSSLSVSYFTVAPYTTALSKEGAKEDEQPLFV
ncbi:fibrillin-3, partial [Biomphalaria pfeifferi]